MISHTDYITIVDIINRQKEVVIDAFLPKVPSLIAATLAVEKVRADYIGVFFLSDRTMRRYHALYYNDPSSTDCMSFPIDEKASFCTGERCLGDIMICPKVAAASIGKNSIARHDARYPGNPSLENELSLYIIHATLHLLGYNDVRKRESIRMRQKEQEVFAFYQKYAFCMKD